MPKRLILVAAGILVILGCTYRDRTPPTVQIIQPAKNATIVAGQTPIKVFADDRELARVELYVDTTVLDTFEAGVLDTFSYTWDATGEVPGSAHVIVARAADRWGNTAEDSCHVMLAGGTGPTQHSADVTVDEVWWPSGNPHVVATGINVSQSATLTILPGCAVQFDSGAGLTVGLGSPGEIQAIGTPDSGITFVSSLASPGRGAWYGLRFYEGTRWSSRLSYCQIENGGELGGAAVSLLWGAIVKMDHTTITGSAGYGIDFSQQGHCTDFDYNTITGCTGNPMRIHPDAVRFLGPNNNLAGNGTDEIVVDSGTVAASGTWRNHGMPYIVAGGVQVGGAALPVLTVEPGAVLKFSAGAGLECGQTGPGGLVADGTGGQITFTSAAGAPQPGDWKSIYFRAGALDQQCRLRNCLIEYGGGDGKGNVVIRDARPQVSGCSIGYSPAWGIYLDGTEYPDPDSLEAGNTFHSNDSGNVRRP